MNFGKLNLFLVHFYLSAYTKILMAMLGDIRSGGGAGTVVGIPPHGQKRRAIPAVLDQSEALVTPRFSLLHEDGRKDTLLDDNGVKLEVQKYWFNDPFR